MNETTMENHVNAQKEFKISMSSVFKKRYTIQNESFTYLRAKRTTTLSRFYLKIVTYFTYLFTNKCI